LESFYIDDYRIQKTGALILEVCIVIKM
jgi:hypothetical protein